MIRDIGLYVAAALALACSVDETGYLDGSKVNYTGREALSADDSDIFVVGEPGAIRATDGVLSISNSEGDRVPTVAVNADGSFVASVAARLGGAVTLSFQRGAKTDTLVVDITDTLDKVPLSPDDGSRPGNTPAFRRSDAGFLEINWAAVNAEIPLVVFVPRVGRSIHLDSRENATNLGVEIGDEVCIFRHERDAGSSISSCEQVM